MAKLFLTLGVLALLQVAKCMPSSGLQELRELVFNENYTVQWQANFDTKMIDFNLTVKTTGFVGFGISPQGAMTGADIFIGGVLPVGVSYSDDYHGVGNERPEVDAIKNWELIDFSEADGITFLQVRRQLDTCDTEEDINIIDGTQKFIWAIGETDDISYHGSTNRGSRSVQVLDAQTPPINLESYEKFELRGNFTTPTDSDTKYWCRIHKRTATRKSHIVAFLPILETPEALAHTHHYQVTLCKPPPGGPTAEEIYEPWVDFEGEECYQNNPVIPRQYCNRNVYAWSNGGEQLVFPEDIGVPWGEDENEYFLFNVHVNNPDLLDVSFQTGVTMYFTEELRPIEAEMFEVYHNSYPSLMTPPATKDWTLVGHCSSRCTEAGIEPEGINILVADLHAHVSGRSITVRHFRDRVELPWLIKDDNYDFDYQEFRTLPEPVKILPGDALSIECTYDSTWKSPPSAVIGGFQTIDEMCIMFAYYYPKGEIKHCGSVLPIEPIFERYGVTNHTLSFPTYDPVITEPENLAGVSFSELMTSYVDWTDEEKAAVQQLMRYGQHVEQCSVPLNGEMKMGKNGLISSTDDLKQEYSYVTYPEIDEEYTEPSTCAAV